MGPTIGQRGRQGQKCGHVGLATSPKERTMLKAQLEEIMRSYQQGVIGNGQPWLGPCLLGAPVQGSFLLVVPSWSAA